MSVMTGVAGLLAASALIATPAAALMSQEEEEALVARVEDRIWYAVGQPQHRTKAHPFGVPPHQEDDENDDGDDFWDDEEASDDVEESDDVEDSEVAEASSWGLTMAKVMLKCSGTSESVYKCVSITATANAYAEATATAHASAVSNAVNACGCLTEAVAEGMNNADVYVKLVAEAASTATAEVCVSGTKLVKKRAYDSCVSSVYAKIFADATAEAIVEGNCLSAEAVADVLVEAGATVDDGDATSTCGMDPQAFEFDPNEDGPVEEDSTEAAQVAETPLEDSAEEERATMLLKALLDRTPVDDSASDAESPVEEPAEVPTEEAPAPVAEAPMPTITVKEEKEIVPPVEATSTPTETATETVAPAPGAAPVHEEKSHPEAHGTQAAAWAQCGGEGWTGATACVEGFECRPQPGNKWYSQCRND